MAAARFKQAEVLRLLLEHGADMEATNNVGSSALNKPSCGLAVGAGVGMSSCFARTKIARSPAQPAVVTWRCAREQSRCPKVNGCVLLRFPMRPHRRERMRRTCAPTLSAVRRLKEASSYSDGIGDAVLQSGGSPQACIHPQLICPIWDCS